MWNVNMVLKVQTIQKVRSEPCHLSPHTSDLLSAHTPPSPHVLCRGFTFPVFPLRDKQMMVIGYPLPHQEGRTLLLFFSQQYILELTS